MTTTNHESHGEEHEKARTTTRKSMLYKQIPIDLNKIISNAVMVRNDHEKNSSSIKYELGTVLVVATARMCFDDLVEKIVEP